MFLEHELGALLDERLMNGYRRTIRVHCTLYNKQCILYTVLYYIKHTLCIEHCQIKYRGIYKRYKFKFYRDELDFQSAICVHNVHCPTSTLFDHHFKYNFP